MCVAAKQKLSIYDIVIDDYKVSPGGRGKQVGKDYLAIAHGIEGFMGIPVPVKIEICAGMNGFSARTLLHLVFFPKGGCIIPAARPRCADASISIIQPANR